MKEALTKNLGLKVLALAISILLWFVVMNIETPISKKTFTDIPVTLLHTEIVTNPGNTYRVAEESKTISVTVKARRDVLNKIKAEDIKAVADVMDLDTTTRTLIPIQVTIPEYLTMYEEAVPSDRNLEITIEMATSKTFLINPISSGTPRDGYEIGELEADPKQIKISGPESVVNSIEKVVAEVDVSGLSKDTKLEAEMVLYNGAGIVIDSTLIEHNLGEEGLSVKVKVLHTKDVPIHLDTSKVAPADGYVLEDITVQPETIEIIGSEEELEEVDAIEVPADAIAESNLTKTVEKTIDITGYLPSWAKIKEESAGAKILVKIAVTKTGTRTIEYPVSSISLLNVPKGYKVSYPSAGIIEISVRGSQEALDNFELEQGSVSLNLVTLKEAGTYTLPVQVTLGEGVELDKHVTVPIVLEKIVDEEEEGEPGND